MQITVDSAHGNEARPDARCAWSREVLRGEVRGSRSKEVDDLDDKEVLQWARAVGKAERKPSSIVNSNAEQDCGRRCVRCLGPLDPMRWLRMTKTGSVPGSPPFQLSSAQNRAVLTVARASPATVLHNVKHWQLLSRREIGTYSLEVPDRRRIIPTTSGSKASGQTRVEGVMANEQQ